MSSFHSLNMTQEAFDQLLAWLNRDRDQAGKKYEDIRRTLIKIFTCRRCNAPEALADRTIDRVTRKLPEIEGNYVGERARYFLGVARNIYREYVREREDALPLPPESTPASVMTQEKEIVYDCLTCCMEGLQPDERGLIIDYFRENKQAKIDLRKELANKSGITPNALRLRVHRIIANLRECVAGCAGEERQGSSDYCKSSRGCS
jgi:DNA-directed RNA polymerase specialized sigma24 family protein